MTKLDISIQSIEKIKDKRFILNENVTVEHKTDGVKITALCTDKKWIVAYKGNILYEEEFTHTNNLDIKEHSIGASQFKIVLDHFKNISTEDIPDGMEFFVEFLMKKPTLSSNYTTNHKMVLIGYTDSTFDKELVKYGQLITRPGEFKTASRPKYAKILKIDIPNVLFEGRMTTKDSFKAGIKSDDLQKIFAGTKEHNLEGIKKMFLEVPSIYGGVEEGVVLIYSNKLLKIQQDYQTDQKARAIIKEKYRGTVAQETTYWKEVKVKAKNLISGNNKGTFKERLLLLSKEITVIDLPKHPKRNQIQTQDDVQLTAKNMISRKLPGNNNVLFIGKFRLLTKKHYKIITDLKGKYDNVVVALITSKVTKETRDFRYTNLSKIEGIEIIENTSGNISTLLNKTNRNINMISAGTDRAESYRDYLKNTQIGVDEVKRDDGISSSDVIAHIEDFEHFKENTPEFLHAEYEKTKEIYGNSK